jgi:hypothetical protein
MKLQAKNIDGKPVTNPLHKSALLAWTKKHKDGTVYDIEVTKWAGTLTARQRRYYFMIVGIISNHLGYDKNDFHHEIKKYFKHFDGEQVNPFTGETEPKVKSITKMDTAEMATLIDEVFRFGAVEYELTLPIPDYGE